MFYLNRLVQLISKISMLLSRFISRYNFSGRHFFIDFLRLPKPYPSDTTLSFQLNSNPTQTCFCLSATHCRFGLDTNLKGNMRQKWQKLPQHCWDWERWRKEFQFLWSLYMAAGNFPVDFCFQFCFQLLLSNYRTWLSIYPTWDLQYPNLNQVRYFESQVG